MKAGRIVLLVGLMTIVLGAIMLAASEPGTCDDGATCKQPLPAGLLVIWIGAITLIATGLLQGARAMLRKRP